MIGSATPAAAQTAREEPTIVEVAAEAGSFQTLIAALEAAGLAETLGTDGPFTVFAPTDDSFAALPDGTVQTLLKPENREMLRAVLTYHVVAGRLEASDVIERWSLETLQGESLKVKAYDGAVKVGGAKVVTANVSASNGVIHVIDAVLLPEAAR
ncbi:MAG: fasciclin domain-containing protein [Gemmatimonadota bacterium]|nr:fasciclin domain-containing protein [Gemmatimonadota bacterium]